MEDLLNLYANLDNLDPPKNVTKKTNKSKPKGNIKGFPQFPQKAPITQKKKEIKNVKKSPQKNKISIDAYNPLSIFTPKMKSDDNDDDNIIPGDEDIKSKIDIKYLENVIENLNDKKYKYKSVEELQKVLQKKAEENNITKEASIVFLVYCWITKNISYYIGNNPDNTPLGALQKRITQCSGYSRLFKEILKLFNIKSVLVHGCGRTYSLSIKPKIENHEWNAVKINGKYYLCELTWGSGKVENGKFIPSYNIFYFCCPPEQFIQTHLPSKDLEKWQLLTKKISQNEFDNCLYKDKFFYFYEFTEIYPKEGVVKLNNNFCDIKIVNKKEVKGLRLSCKVYLEQKLIENVSCIEKFDNYFLIHLIFNQKGKYNILIFCTDKSGIAHSDLILRQQYIISSSQKENYYFPNMLTFPDDLHIIQPKYNNLFKNKEILFQFSSNDIDDMGIVVNKKCFHLDKKGNIFEGKYTLKGDEVLVGKFTPDNPRSLKVMAKYSINK